MNIYPRGLYSRFEFGDMTALFLKADDRHLLFCLIPACMENEIPEHRKTLNDTVACRGMHAATGGECEPVKFDSMAQLHRMGKPFSSCLFLRNGESTRDLELVGQKKSGGRLETLFRTAAGLEFRHIIEYRRGDRYLRIHTEITNAGKRRAEIGLQESFSLNVISPFHPDDAADALKLHRYRCSWSGEGRHEENFFEDLNIEPSWNGWWPRGIRFGQRESMPAHEYSPTAGVEDIVAGVTWGVQLAAVAPWQMTLYREGDFASLSGGFPDFDFAGWRRRLAPGETSVSCTAVVTCVKGDMEAALNRLNTYPVDYAEKHPAAEKDLPVIFNEFCTTWCHPTEENLRPVIDKIKGSGIRYFVIDDGWFVMNDDLGKGDWTVDEAKYPHGFDAFLDSIRKAGMIPGIWFEFEHCTKNSKVWKEHPDWMITWERRIYDRGTWHGFFDFRKKEVCDYFDEHLIKFLKRHRIGYMKVDYNHRFHLADTASGSLAAGVQEALEASRRYFLHLRRELPELVLEICASGGNRLTPEWMRIGDMASFSDCHEGLAVPLIAAQTAFLIPFTQNQIWATLRKGEDKNRTMYQLCSGFLGRLCVSGDAARFDKFQLDRIKEAAALYGGCADILKNGVSHCEPNLASRSRNNPRGCQLFFRTAECGEVIVLHTFGDAPEKVEIPVDGKLAGTFAYGTAVSLKGGKLIFDHPGDFNGAVAVIR